MSARLALLLLIAAIPLAAPVGAAPPAATPFATGALTIAGEAFAVSDVLDARALPDINAKVGIMLTLTPAAAERLGRISAALVGKPLTVALDGKTLGAELIRKPLTSGVIEIPGRWNLTDAEALARRISGRDPLPDDLGE
ncbi:SecDF P1 head subdomain-containing protein [Sphingomonas sp. SRS2]|uniref:SecDF P1 head subdomain-containing protein n=1 Tax=Sphingomonas sp. SRS2 TaxID=133190 RepID=UPI0006184C04|nr:hypothetical protein [Sphingomonas sp. SRS2]KKC23734.1 hypothetical protein WP12_23240 [Sphingomonas sp. SRS2]